MPEIGEVARVVHYLRKHLVSRTISKVTAYEDDIVYGKVGCSASAFQKAVQGRKVTGAAQQGKYFYITFDKPPHAVLHLGMTGWIKFNCEDTQYYKQAKEKKEEQEWPPKYAKFLLHCDEETVQGTKREQVEVAFVDARRLARIRLVDCKADEIRVNTPLKENGPDPVVDKDIFTVQFFTELARRKRVPIKALLLDQANISGVGNWVADEVLYQARIHPEQYSNTFDDEQLKRIHQSIVSVCTTACETLADSTKFPEEWIMKYRWDKGKKDANTLPNGNKIVHLKVGGRTSAVVPAVQKKTAAVAGDVDPSEQDEEDTKPTRGKKRKTNVANGDNHEPQEANASGRTKKAASKGAIADSEKESDAVAGADDEDGLADETPKQKKGKKRTSKIDSKPSTPGSRRSTRSTRKS